MNYKHAADILEFHKHLQQAGAHKDIGKRKRPERTCHEHLLVLLRALNKGVAARLPASISCPSAGTCWHEELTGSFRRTLEQRGRLDL